MSKIIIKNESNLSMSDCLILVRSVIDRGRISNNGNQYCFLTAFDIGGKEYCVQTGLNKSSDTFVIFESAKP